MQVTKGTWHMCEQCVPGSLSSSPAREPGNEASFHVDWSLKLFLLLHTQNCSTHVRKLGDTDTPFSLKCTCTFVSVRSIQIFGIWPHIRTQTDIHTRLAMLSR